MSQKTAPRRFRIAAASLAMILWLAPTPNALELKNLVTATLAVTDVQNVIARAVTQAVDGRDGVTPSGPIR